MMVLLAALCATLGPNFVYSVEQYADAEKAYSLPKKISQIFVQLDF